MVRLKIIYLIIFAIIAIERILNTFQGKEQEGRIHHKWTAPVLMSTYSLVILIALFEFVVCTGTLNFLMTGFGIFVMAIGIILRRAAIKTLGPNWSVHLKEMDRQELITNGPYRFFRHPYYVAVMFELTGAALYFNSPAALIFLYFIHFPLLLYRTKLEERILEHQFGERYRNYCRKKVEKRAL